MSMVELTENLVIPMVGSECKHSHDNHVSCTNFKVGITREQQLVSVCNVMWWDLLLAGSCKFSLASSK